ncbi:Serine/threonine-protein kinase CLA4 [Sphaceloma murrayae]|uniref:Serine/threonine-protein kinase CLA4 n=1 Tax=Sphaceloma murrayae TaxID=2082308 RepID=A0A2K1QV11_9PEZI|nr:Serine/threonine-protein kinase CLA4 [Sphaceloma murrayae]
MASTRYQWLVFAIASGACAAINGTFAKLYVVPPTVVAETPFSSENTADLHSTTGPFTSSVATSFASFLHVPAAHSQIFEYALRALFFALNLSFDALMWGLFTRALTLASSTVHVSVLNTSTNFLVAASAGWLVFGEKLPGLWWVGAAMLIGGCFVIGRRGGREEEKKGAYVRVDGEGNADGEEVPLGKWEVDDPLPGAEGAGPRSRSPYRDEDGVELDR